MMAQNTYRFYKLLLWKVYLEKGYGLSHIIFKVIAVLGLTSQNLQNTIWAIVIYFILCFIGGRYWYKKGLMETEQEIYNRVNPFVKEMRESYSVNRKP